MSDLDGVLDWVLRLGDDHGVDPVVYAIIWIGSLPFFLLSLGWLVRSLRRRESLMMPLVTTAFFFLAPALYVVVAGRDLPWWVYGLLLLLTVLGAISTARRVRRRVRSEG